MTISRLVFLAAALAGTVGCAGVADKDSGTSPATGDDGGAEGSDGSDVDGDGAADGNDRLEPISDDPLCETAPIVTWDSWGEGFMIGGCQACHSATSVRRLGAPEEINFDTREEVLAVKDRVLARATGDAPSMPPEGGVLADDRELLEIWLTCWE